MDTGWPPAAQVREFKAQWRSALSVVLLSVVVLLVGLLLLGHYLLKWHVLVNLAVLAMGAAVLWRIGSPLVTGRPMLRLTPDGISGLLVRTPVPWSALRHMEPLVQQGTLFLLLRLDSRTAVGARHRHWWSRGEPQLRLSLNMLGTAQAHQAVQAALAAFAAHGGPAGAASLHTQVEAAAQIQDFEAALTRRTPHPWALWALVALNVGVWVATVVAGLSPAQPDAADLLRWGGNSAWAVIEEMQWWRLLTSTVLHSGIVHLAMNMVGLWSVGLLLNRMVGNTAFLGLYLLCGLAGAAASLHFAAQTAVSVGASGAVFGVATALLVLVRRERARLPPALSRQILSSQTVFLGYSLLQGFTRPGIDNAAHVGGLCAGAVLGLVLGGALSPDSARASTRRRAWLGGLAVVGAIGGLIATTPAPALDHANAFIAARRVQELAPLVQRLAGDVQADAKAFQAGSLDEATLLRRLQDRHLPALQQAEQALAAVPRAHGDPRRPVLEDLQVFTTAMRGLLELQIRALQGQPGPNDAIREQALFRQINGASARMRDRMEAGGRQRGG